MIYIILETSSDNLESFTKIIFASTDKEKAKDKFNECKNLCTNTKDDKWWNEFNFIEYDDETNQQKIIETIDNT